MPLIAPKFFRNRLTWLAYLMLAYYGYFLNILGPIAPFLKEELSLSYTVSSLHFTAFAVGILCVGLGGHVLIRWIGPSRALWIGAVGMSGSVLLLIIGRTPTMTIGACFFMGLIGSLILAIVPSTLSDQHGELRSIALSEANVVSSMVSALAPLMVGVSAYWLGGWRPALGIVAMVPLVMRLSFGHVTLPTTETAPKDTTAKKESLPFLYWVYWIAIVLAVSVEFCMVFWSADYMQHAMGMQQADAAQAVSLFLLGMIGGRLAGSRLVPRIPIQLFVAFSILIAGVGFMLYWQAQSVLPGLIGLILTGLGVGSLYPLILSLAIGAAGNQTVQAGARATLASGVAIVALPLVLGRLADAVGIRSAYGVVALLLIAALLIIFLAGKLSPVRQVQVQ
ncbi:MAG: MFS transporter [Anaerolineae bacterium]